MSDALTFEALQRAKRPVVEKVPIVLDPEWAQEVHTARQKLAQADLVLLRDDDNPKAAAHRSAALERLSELRQEQEQAEQAGNPKVARFEFRALSRLEYQQVVDDHPPSPEDNEAAQKRNSMALWNSDTFPPAIVAATLQSPRLSTDQVMILWNDRKWPAGDLNALFLGAQRACTRRVEAPDFDDLDDLPSLLSSNGFGDGLDEQVVGDLLEGGGASFS
jgi:hypothetical protein